MPSKLQNLRMYQIFAGVKKKFMCEVSFSSEMMFDCRRYHFEVKKIIRLLNFNKVLKDLEYCNKWKKSEKIPWNS